jgi:hypothetical protein
MRYVVILTGFMAAGLFGPVACTLPRQPLAVVEPSYSHLRDDAAGVNATPSVLAQRERPISTASR